MAHISRRSALLGLASSATIAVAGCSSPDDENPSGTPTPAPGDDATPNAEAPHRVVAKDPIDPVVIPADDSGVIGLSQAVLEVATAVVVVQVPEAAPTEEPSPSDDATADPETSTEPTGTPQPEDSEEPVDLVAQAASAAEELGLPLLVDGPELNAELDRLQTGVVVRFAEGSLDVGDREVVDLEAARDLGGLPRTPESVDAIALMTEDEQIPPAVAATLAAAGVELVTVDQTDPRATGDSVALVKGAAGVLALGAAFGESERFATRLEDARTIEELPGGGVAPYPGRMMIALYGHPSGPTLGILGEQGPEESVALVQRYAEEYQQFSDKPVIGCFEIITTVATANAGDDGNYSRAWPIDSILPLVDAAEAAGVYCVLDLQPGYNTFLDQAQIYEEVLKRPHVGLALDPEWRLVPPQRHMTVIGQVHADEINEVGRWLADLTRENNLPPKVLVLHQFQTRMIVDRDQIDTSRDEIQYLMHADGHGNHGQKLETWRALRNGLSEDIWLGWKNFIDEDTPMMTVEQTMNMVEPTPDFVSYQ